MFYFLWIVTGLIGGILFSKESINEGQDFTLGAALFALVVSCLMGPWLVLVYIAIFKINFSYVLIKGKKDV